MWRKVIPDIGIKLYRGGGWCKGNHNQARLHGPERVRREEKCIQPGRIVWGHTIKGFKNRAEREMFAFYVRSYRERLMLLDESYAIVRLVLWGYPFGSFQKDYL